MDVAKEIFHHNQDRHAHNAHSERCKSCGCFVSKGEPENGQLRYTCNSCGKAILEYVATA